MSDFYTFYLECDGQCGFKITLESKSKTDPGLDACAEALGWTTVDKKDDRKNKQEVYCPDCQARARRIVNQIGMGDR